MRAWVFVQWKRKRNIGSYLSGSINPSVTNSYDNLMAVNFARCSHYDDQSRNNIW